MPGPSVAPNTLLTGTALFSNRPTSAGPKARPSCPDRKNQAMLLASRGGWLSAAYFIPVG